jgi:hypothetical protein
MITATQEIKYLEILELLEETEIDLDSFIKEFDQGFPNDLNACL